MLRRFLLAAFTCLLFAPLARADEPKADEPKPDEPHADDLKPNLAEVKSKEQLQAITEVAGLPVINARSIEEIVQVTVQNNDMKLITPLRSTDESLVRIAGMPGLSRVKSQGAGDGEDFVLVQFNFENRDYTVPSAVAAFSSISYAAGTTTLAQAWETLDDETYSVQLLQNNRAIGEGEPRVSLYVQITGDPPVDLRLNADNVIELRRQHPAEVAKYVDPILRALRQGELLAGVDAKLAWQVFADAYQPTDHFLAQVKAVVAKLNAEDFQARENASAELDQLAQPAALVLMRMDRSGLTDEQRGRIDAFVAKFKSVPDEQALRFRHDRDFLIDCLHSNEPAIQTRALAALRLVTGKEIPFDFSLDSAQRALAIARLRESFGTPATRQFKS